MQVRFDASGTIGVLKHMRRLVAFALALAIAGAAFAQTFTIRRPQDGSIVREVVQVRLPKNSIPPGSYVGFWINGKFLEAVGLDAVDIQGNDYVYKLDTKERKLPDGKLSIEAVLYADFEEAPKVINRSSVEVTLDNSRSIKIPEGGLKLRYLFKPGTQLTYSVEAKVTEATITEAQRQLGGRMSEEMIDTQKFRWLVAFDNVYKTPTGNEALVRMQLLPQKGKDYAVLNLKDNTDGVRYYEENMVSTYLRLTETGREVFGSVPAYFGLEGFSPQMAINGIYIPFTLPVLPSQGVKPGTPFSAAFQNLRIDPSTQDLLTAGKLTVQGPGRGTLEGVEWEGGIPCAKIKNTIEVGVADSKQTVEETYWFALDRRCVIKFLRVVTAEVKVGGDTGGAAGGAPAGRSGGLMGPPGRGGGDDDDGRDFGMSPQGRRGGGLQGGGGGVAPGDTGGQGRGGSRGGGGGLMGPPGAAGSGGGVMGPAGRGGATGGGGRAGSEFVRLRFQYLVTLEK